MKQPHLTRYPWDQLSAGKREECSKILYRLARTEITRSLQDDCKAFISPALEAADESFLVALRSNFRKAEKACTIYLPKLVVHIAHNVVSLERDKRADVAFFVEIDTGAYIQLSGEHEDGSLNLGLKGYRLPLYNAKDEVNKIVGLWTEHSDSIKRQYEGSSEYYAQVSKALTQDMRPLESREKFLKAYIFPTYKKYGRMPS